MQVPHDSQPEMADIPPATTPEGQAANRPSSSGFSFIHAADLHIDSPLRGLARHADAPVDELRSATRLATVIAGDIFDGDWQDMSTGLFFNRQMARLGQAGIRVYMIRGNHDARSVITSKLQLPDNVVDFPTSSPATEELDDLPVAIHGMGFAKRHIEQNLVPDYPPPLVGKFNIGLLHTSLAGSDLHDTYAPCTLGELTEFGYDYWALGHIHKREILSSNPHVVFSGNIQGRHIRETGPRGCYLVKVDAGSICSAQFHALDVLHWFHVKVDVDGLSDESEVIRRVRENIESVVNDSGDRLLALRVSLQGQTSLSSNFHLQRDNWFNEVLSVAQQSASAGVWLESMKVQTTEPAGSDSNIELSDLGSMVLQNLQTDQLQASIRESAWPVEITQMLNKLGSQQKRDVEAVLLADSPSSTTAGATSSIKSGGTSRTSRSGETDTADVAADSGKLASDHLLDQVSSLVNAAVRGKRVATIADLAEKEATAKPVAAVSRKSGAVRVGDSDGPV